LRNIEKRKLKKASVSAHPICLLFASDDVIPGKQATKQPIEC